MNILHINKFDRSGGAAVACMRISNALLKKGCDVSVLCETKQSSGDLSKAYTLNPLKKIFDFIRFGFERFTFILVEKNKSIRFAFSPGNTGVSIANHKMVKNADVINIHWINQGFLSLKNLEELFKLNKKIVWTMHDMWTFTGGCHYAGNCIAYKSECGNCPFVKQPNSRDISNRIWKKKQRIFKKYEDKIEFVACSPWLTNIAKQSSLLKNFKIETIPNPIDTQVFKSLDKNFCRQSLGLDFDKKYILFGAMNVNDYRKGFTFFFDALNILKENGITDVRVIIFGKMKAEIKLPFPAIYYSYIESEQMLVTLYNAADMYVHSSLEDNLPNMIMEAMACKTPIVAFNTGGIPSMISNNQEGFLAENASAQSLSECMLICLNSELLSTITENALCKVNNEYNEYSVASQYLKLYNKPNSSSCD